MLFARMMLRFLGLPVATFAAFLSSLTFFPAAGISQEYSGCFMVISSGRVVDLNNICINEKTVSRSDQLKVVILIQQGVDKHGEGDYEGAIEDYTKALQSNPNDALAYFSRAAARDELKDYQGAIKDLQQAVKLVSVQRDPLLYQEAVEQLNRIRQLQQF